MFKRKKKETIVSALKWPVEDYFAPVAESAPEVKKFEAKPIETPVDYPSLRKSIMRRYSKSIEYLAK